MLGEIKLLSLKAGGLFPTLSSKRQKLNNSAVRPTDFSSGEDDAGELVVVQHSVPSHLLRRSGLPAYIAADNTSAACTIVR